MNRTLALSLITAVAIGFGLRFVCNLEPVSGFAWIVPGMLLALALLHEGWTARGLIVLAAGIGVSSILPYFLKVMPLVPAVLVMLLLTLLWMFVIGRAQRTIQQFKSGWTVLALPVFAVAADTVLAHFTPDGNWGSIAYTQTEVLPVAQLAALFGMSGILFLVMLVNSALALAVVYGRALRGAVFVYGGTALLVAVAVGYGFARLATPVAGTPIAFGIAAVDNFIAESKSGDSQSPDPQSRESQQVWAQYTSQIQQLASSGAKFVLLPEKIEVLASSAAESRKSQISALAQTNQVWLVTGLGVDDGSKRHNEAWWFAPDGSLATNYRKHYMAPPEREFAPGVDYAVNNIDGVRYGVAICKDMHFASLGREYGALDVAVMLVPAWDFIDDAWLAAGMTKMRGIENGYTVVRSSREGLLSITDPYGRFLAVEHSSRLPGATLFKKVVVGPHVSTLYTKIGDVLGWVCVLAAVAFTVLSSIRRRQDPIA